MSTYSVSFSCINQTQQILGINTLKIALSSEPEKKSKQYSVVIFRTLFSYASLESIFSIILNSFWRMLPHIFYEPYNSRSLAMLGFSRRYYLISKRKQHTFRTFNQISKSQGKQ